MSELSRRDLLLAAGAAAGVTALAKRAGAQSAGHEHHHPPAPKPPARAPARPRPTPAGWQDGGTVITPNGARMPWKNVDGIKVFHIVAEPVQHEIVEGLDIEAWGYNGRTPGPTIEVTEGDRCRFYVTNHLPEETTIHWHGVFLPNGMDGVGGLTQKSIPPGETYIYEFTFTKPGTFLYHPHFDEMTQIALGMEGMIVVHPRRGRRPDRDYAILLHEWDIPAGARRPNPLAMSDFNVLTMNSRAFPGTAPLVAELGDRVRIRLGNLGPMDHHPIHIHGHAFSVVETDGGPVAPAARRPETTVLVPVGTVRVVELVADAAGDWPFHCHMTHHVMNQMGHDVPNLVGADLTDADRRIRKLVPGYMTMGQTGMGGMGEMGMAMPKNSVSMKGAAGPFGFIDMGGMFTIIKIRERLPGGGDPGWYAHPPGTVSSAATKEQLARDGIDVG
jgi:FtsP/CotA-like multicopper oxidase with cupredoxin domain